MWSYTGYTHELIKYKENKIHLINGMTMVRLTYSGTIHTAANRNID